MSHDNGTRWTPLGATDSGPQALALEQQKMWSKVLLLLKPLAVVKGLAVIPPIVRVNSAIVAPELPKESFAIPIVGSSVPGCDCPDCPAVTYAHNLETRYKDDQRTIMDLRAGADRSARYTG